MSAPDSYKTKEHLEEYRRALRMLCDHAYKMGFHEMGYDPIEYFEAAVRDSRRGPVDKGPVPVECPDTKAPCMEFCDADKGDQCARTNEQISTMTDAEKATYWFDLYLEETTKRRELERRLSLGATPQHTKEDV
jgi:predicted Fe-S protein YdhL (DUF1289 family)